MARRGLLGLLAVFVIALCTEQAFAHGVAACETYVDSRVQPDVDRVAREDPFAGYAVDQVDSEYTARGAYGSVGHKRARINAVLDNGYHWNCASGHFELPPPVSQPPTTVAPTTTVAQPPQTVDTLQPVIVITTTTTVATSTTTTTPLAATSASTTTTVADRDKSSDRSESAASPLKRGGGQSLPLVPLLIAASFVLGAAFAVARVVGRSR